MALLGTRAVRRLNARGEGIRSDRLGDRIQLLDTDGTLVGGGAQGFIADTGGVAANDVIVVTGYDTTTGLLKMDKADADTEALTQDLYWTDAAVSAGAQGTALRTGNFVSALNGAVGDEVYLSTVAGGVTLAAPTGANFVVQVGSLATAGATGRVSIELGGEKIIVHDHTDNASGGLVSVGGALTGTTAAAFEVDNDGTVPALALGSQAAGTGDFTQTLKPASTLTVGDADITIPDTAGGAEVFVLADATQILTAKTLTTPTIGDFTNSTHDHSNAAGGGAISVTDLSGTTSDTFEINTDGNSVIIDSAGLGADRTWTYPDSSDETVGIAATQTLTNKTITGATIDGGGTIDNTVIGNGTPVAGDFTTLGATGTATLNDVAIGGGYGSTGVTISAAGVLQANGAGTFDGALDCASLACTAAATFGGGYGSTGATISTAGVGQFNDALTTDGVLTADSIVCTEGATFGGGFGVTGATISTAGVGQFDGDLSSAGAVTAGAVLTGAILVCTASATFGGGYGSTGATISTAGVGNFNGALTTDGLLTSTSSVVSSSDTTDGIVR